MIENLDYFDLYAQVRPTSLVIFARSNKVKNYVKERDVKSMAIARAINPFYTEEESTAYSCRFTNGARNRLKCATDILLLLAKERKIFNPISNNYHPFRYSFTTLTFSSKKIVDYATSIKCLEEFLKWLNRTKGALMYVWKLELQKRGQIHFHILSDVFVHWREVRDKWNYIQARHTDILGGMDYNSTDIHSIHQAKDVGQYIAKYISKNEDAPEVLAKMKIKKFWGCSKNLQGQKRFTFQYDARFDPLPEMVEIMNAPNLYELECSEFASYYRFKDTDKNNSTTKTLMQNEWVRYQFRKWAHGIIPNYHTELGDNFDENNILG